LYRIDVNLKKATVVWRFNCTKDFDVASKNKILEVVDGIAQVIIECTEKQRPPKTNS
jgi:hypothetical protein